MLRGPKPEFRTTMRSLQDHDDHGTSKVFLPRVPHSASLPLLLLTVGPVPLRPRLPCGGQLAVLERRAGLLPANPGGRTTLSAEFLGPLQKKGRRCLRLPASSGIFNCGIRSTAFPGNAAAT